MRFTFAGAEYEAREGETLAAALVRNGVRGGFRSVTLSRPRGVYAAHEEEPNAFVQIGARPMVRATLVDVEDRMVAEPLAGKGRLVVFRDNTRYDAMNAHCDVLVVGGGRSGRAAAGAAAGDVLLLEQFACEPLDGVRVLARTVAVGLYDHGYVIAVQLGRRLWRIRAKRIVLATGALERPEVFAGNDVPGVMLASAAEHYGLEDVVTTSGGWTPRVHLWSQARGRLRWDDRIGAPVPDGELPNVECIGRVTGAGLPDAAPLRLPDDESTAFVDLERDVTVAGLRRAVDAGLTSIEHIKRYTTLGTGSDQGKTANVNALHVLGALLDVHPGDLGTTTSRPPYVSVSFALLAGRNRGDLFDPVRVTPIHERHAELGAVWENVGQWKRPRYYPRGGEDMDAAVLRECAAVREHVGMQDVSTLGKIDVQGPDAGDLLDRLYTNVISSLAVGMCRYAVMCRPDGMVFDDGVVMRVGENRFICTTTTGNAAAVLAWMEEWLQTEWPHLRVWLASVTEQWATVAVAGPRSRAMLGQVTDLDLSAVAFPFMAIREGDVAGIPARVARISFSGELAYEVSVDGRRGLELWRALEDLGEATPYGTEAMHVLRAEKAYPIVGQDTDATVTPHDLGLGWIVSKTKGDFVGKRSFSRVDTSRADRKQLVALLPVDPELLLPEGAQLLDGGAPAVGHVTGSYRSAALGRTFALALVAGGRERVGETLAATVPGGTADAVVHEPVLWDPEGARRDGVAA